MKGELMTTGEVARLLTDVVPATVRGWANKGLLPVQRTRTGLRLFKKSDVVRLARQRGKQRLETGARQVGSVPPRPDKV